jgi:hypothetical protein
VAGSPTSGGGSIAAASGTSTVVDTAGFAGTILVHSLAAGWIGDAAKLGSTSGATTLSATNATPLAAGVMYEFDIKQGLTRYIHVAGNGVTSTITVTLTS